MSTKGTHGRGTRGRRGARARSLSSGHMPSIKTREASALPVTETRFHECADGDDALSQAMLQILESQRLVLWAMGRLRNGSCLMELRFLGVLLELPLMWINIGLRT